MTTSKEKVTPPLVHKCDICGTWIPPNEIWFYETDRPALMVPESYGVLGDMCCYGTRGTYPRRPTVDELIWRMVRVNMSFLDTLQEHIPPGKKFTNEDAYRLYYMYHAKTYSWENLPDGGYKEHVHSTYEKFPDGELEVWQQMEVRNNLSASAYRGYMIRHDAGEYELPSDLGMPLSKIAHLTNPPSGKKVDDIYFWMDFPWTHFS